MKIQCTRTCGDVKQRLYYFYNFFYENRQVIRQNEILQLLLHFTVTIQNSDNLVFEL